jgi:hypothetical protein
MIVHWKLKLILIGSSLIEQNFFLNWGEKESHKIYRNTIHSLLKFKFQRNYLTAFLNDIHTW